MDMGGLFQVMCLGRNLVTVGLRFPAGSQTMKLSSKAFATR